VRNAATNGAVAAGAATTTDDPKRAELERKIAGAKLALDTAREEGRPLTDAWYAASRAARKARMANLKARLLAAAPKDRVGPADRVAFSSGDEAAPCAVCWRRHTSADPQGIRALVELAWARGGVTAA
jgi:hypothetical protein